jgi:hypothetical protein
VGTNNNKGNKQLNKPTKKAVTLCFYTWYHENNNNNNNYVQYDNSIDMTTRPPKFGLMNDSLGREFSLSLSLSLSLSQLFVAK